MVYGLVQALLPGYPQTPDSELNIPGLSISIPGRKIGIGCAFSVDSLTVCSPVIYSSDRHPTRSPSHHS